ncbi:hypothetical protein OPV22_000496 [Ensete ventricosum]|uniref:Uncharacterized protein n=1 Tax=Ensete ventricosum TaxID=4639 RepID=A0AAV8RT46_ENSVE|nr:hypothetical protein OPV22_000496 [Ensete ventricosum]
MPEDEQRRRALLSPSQDPATQLPPGPSRLLSSAACTTSSAPSPQRKLGDLARVHGPLVLLRLCEVDLVVVSSGEGAEEVVRAQDLNFAYRPELTVPRTRFLVRRTPCGAPPPTERLRNFTSCRRPSRRIALWTKPPSSARLAGAVDARAAYCPLAD